jgi:hypothetical protein
MIFNAHARATGARLYLQLRDRLNLLLAELSILYSSTSTFICKLGRYALSCRTVYRCTLKNVVYTGHGATPLLLASSKVAISLRLQFASSQSVSQCILGSRLSCIFKPQWIPSCLFVLSLYFFEKALINFLSPIKIFTEQRRHYSTLGPEKLVVCKFSLGAIDYWEAEVVLLIMAVH